MVDSSQASFRHVFGSVLWWRLGQARDGRDEQLKVTRLDKPTLAALQDLHTRGLMDKLGTWLAVTGVAIGFVIAGLVALSDNPGQNKSP